MKLLKVVIFTSIILLLSCHETDNLKKVSNEKKEKISSCCKDIVSYIRNYFRSGRYGSNYLVILESESKNYNFKNIKEFLKLHKVDFPLNDNFITIDEPDVGVHRASSFGYTDYINRKEFFMYHFEFINSPEIYYNDYDWDNNKYDLIQKNEIINNCLKVNNYCIIIVKIPWKPYLEHLKSIKAVDRYNYEIGIFDSLQKVWDKKDLIIK